MKKLSLILASSSPRRRELLKQAGILYSVEPADADESALPDETPRSHVKRLALLKARTVAARHKKGLVLGADTVVVVDGEILGKPASKAEAKRMLSPHLRQGARGTDRHRHSGRPVRQGRERRGEDEGLREAAYKRRNRRIYRDRRADGQGWGIWDTGTVFQYM